MTVAYETPVAIDARLRQFVGQKGVFAFHIDDAENLVVVCVDDAQPELSKTMSLHIRQAASPMKVRFARGTPHQPIVWMS